MNYYPKGTRDYAKSELDPETKKWYNDYIIVMDDEICKTKGVQITKWLNERK